MKLSCAALDSSYIEKSYAEDLLSDVAAGAHVTISAPAGTGKTSISSLIATKFKPHIWLTLDEEDNDSACFLTNLAHATRTSIGSVDSPQLNVDGKPYELLKAITQHLSTLDTQVFIIEDLHTISSDNTLKFLEYLMKYTSNMFSYVLTSRTHIPATILAIAARKPVISLGFSELALTEAEICTLASRMELDQTQVNIPHIAEITNGWALPVRIFLTSSKTEASSFKMASNGGNQSALLDSLLSTVADNLSTNTREFLCALPYLSYINREICNHVFDISDSSRYLTELMHLGLLTSSNDTDYHWYRLHPLIQKSLRYIAPLDKSTIQNIAIEAIDWLEQQGLIQQALRQAAQVDDIEQIARLILNFRMHFVLRKQFSLLESLYQKIPRSCFNQSPDLFIGYCWNLIENANPQKVVTEIARWQSDFALPLSDQDAEHFHFEIQVLLSTAHLALGELGKTVDCATTAMRLVNQKHKLAYFVAAGNAAITSGVAGDYAKCIGTLQVVAAKAKEHEQHVMSIWANGYIAWFHSLQGNIGKAKSHLARCTEIEAQQQCSPKEFLVLVTMVKLHIAIIEGDSVHAKALIAEAIRTVVDKGWSGFSAWIAIFTFLNAELEGDCCAQNIESLLPAIAASPFSHGAEASIHAIKSILERRSKKHVLLQVNCPSAAVNMVEHPLVHQIRTTDTLICDNNEVPKTINRVGLDVPRPLPVTKLHQVIAALNGCLGNANDVTHVEAIRIFESALLVSIEEQLIYPFVVAMKRSAFFANLISEMAAKREYTAFLKNIESHKLVENLEAVANALNQDMLPNGTTITERETLILQLICKNYSNREISEYLGVKLATTKTHINNLYSKLGTENRKVTITEFCPFIESVCESEVSAGAGLA